MEVLPFGRDAIGAFYSSADEALYFEIVLITSRMYEKNVHIYVYILANMYPFNIYTGYLEYFIYRIYEKFHIILTKGLMYGYIIYNI